ncbi:MAG TPA: hypothetical protein VL866_19380 [Pyrinomonadaceae bacterium]|nr:hypothetical protein [Pyrinomonadaceae bacterium]
MEKKLQRDVLFLKVYSIVITVVLGVIAFTAVSQANQNQKPKFDEIDVERINIVEKDGKLKMVISNAERQHPGVIDGNTLARKRPPGMLFFNEKGDECGGLSFDGNTRGEKGSASALLAFDRFRQDQTVGISYSEGNGQYSAGLRVWDRPEEPLGPVVLKLAEIQKMADGAEKTAAMQKLREMPAAQAAERVMVGRDREQAAVVRLADAKGKQRMKLSVDAAGNPKLEFFDENGKVTFSLPQNPAEKK